MKVVEWDQVWAVETTIEGRGPVVEGAVNEREKYNTQTVQGDPARVTVYNTSIPSTASDGSITSFLLFLSSVGARLNLFRALLLSCGSLSSCSGDRNSSGVARPLFSAPQTLVVAFVPLRSYSANNALKSGCELDLACMSGMLLSACRGESAIVAPLARVFVLPSAFDLLRGELGALVEELLGVKGENGTEFARSRLDMQRSRAEAYARRMGLSVLCDWTLVVEETVEDEAELLLPPNKKDEAGVSD